MDHTAQLSHSAPATNLLHAIAAPFRAIGWLAVMLADRHPIMKSLERLNATSDEALAAKGLTRQGEVARIFGPRFHI